MVLQFYDIIEHVCIICTLYIPTSYLHVRVPLYKTIKLGGGVSKVLILYLKLHVNDSSRIHIYLHGFINNIHSK